MKAPRHWPLCRKVTEDRWIPRTNGQWRGKCFHLMTSSCRSYQIFLVIWFLERDVAELSVVYGHPLQYFLMDSSVWVNAPQRYRQTFNTLRPRQNGRHFPDDIFKCIFLNENVQISIKISLKFVPKGPIHNIPALVQKMAWRRPRDKPLSEPMLVSLLTHKCVTRPQRVNIRRNNPKTEMFLVLSCS